MRLEHPAAHDPGACQASLRAPTRNRPDQDFRLASLALAHYTRNAGQPVVSELDFLKVCGYGHIVADFLGDLLAQRLGGPGFTVDQKRLAGRRMEFAQPA